MRTKEEYARHCERIFREDISESEKMHYSKVYGINRPSAIVEVPEFDVTKQLPQDLMHVLLEGVCPLHMEQYLDYIVNDAALMTLHEINCRIAAFPYAYFSEKPASFSGFDLQGTQTGIINIIKFGSCYQLSIGLQLFKCGSW